MNEVSAPPSPFAPYDPPPSVGSAVTFSGDRREFFNLIARGAALGLVTFGFYRFWLATYVRRHLWSSTGVEGDAPEYTGTAIELLLGFLFALAILVPVYIVYFLVGIQAEIYQAFASIPLAIFLYLFAQFAIYRARRYRLTRTVWRGVRFWMRGSGWDYAWRAGLWMLLVLITLGGALPWRTVALERFKMRNSYYGSLQGRFEGEGLALFKEGWSLWLGSLAVLAFGAFMVRPVPLLALYFLICALGLPFIYGVYKAIEWRWWISGLRLGEVSFQSTLKTGGLLALYWKVIGWSVLIVIVFGSISSAIINAAGTRPDLVAVGAARPWLLIPIAFLYIATAIAIGVATQLYLTRDLWQRVAVSTTVHNLAAAENVIAEGEAANALGEGFADGLDVGGL